MIFMTRSPHLFFLAALMYAQITRAGNDGVSPRPASDWELKFNPSILTGLVKSPSLTSSAVQILQSLF
jgi:hypothetical protein